MAFVDLAQSSALSLSASAARGFVRVSSVEDASSFFNQIRQFLENTEKESFLLFALAEEAAKSGVKCGPDSTIAFVFSAHTSEDSDSKSDGEIAAAAYGPVKGTFFLSAVSSRFVADVSRLFVEELLRFKSKTALHGLSFSGSPSLMAALASAFAAHSMFEAERMEELSYCLTLQDLAPSSQFSALGQMERATAADESQLSEWRYDFIREVKIPGLNLPDRKAPPASEQEKSTMATWLEKTAAMTQTNIKQGNMYIWRDEKGQCASLAVAATQWVNGAVLGSVFTPIELRGRGYSKSLIHALCSLLLTGSYRPPRSSASIAETDSGGSELVHPKKKMVALYADYANPVSNAVYRRCGFKHIGDQWLLSFKEEQKGGGSTS